MPVLKHAPRDKPVGIGCVRRFSWWLVRQSENTRLAIGESVKSDSLAGLYIRVQAFPVAPARLLAINHRPTQSTRLVVSVEGRQVVSVTPTESGILFEQSLLHVEAECLRLMILEIRSHVRQWKLVDLAVPEQDIEQGLAFVLGLLGD